MNRSLSLKIHFTFKNQKGNISCGSLKGIYISEEVEAAEIVAMLSLVYLH